MVALCVVICAVYLSLIIVVEKITILYKFGGRKFGETVHTKNWQIIFWQMPRIAKVSKIIIMCRHLPVNWNHGVLLRHMVKMNHFTVHK